VLESPVTLHTGLDLNLVHNNLFTQPYP